MVQSNQANSQIKILNKIMENMIASRDKDARIWRNKENGHHPMWLKNLFI
jgi:hypothetical protein